MRGASGFLLLLAALAAVPAMAYRREYSVTLEGARKPGSEVCFYGARSTADAFSLYFTYPRAACLSADVVLDLPAGIFHVFARHPEGYVSEHPDFFVSDGAAPEQGYELLEIPLRKAATADFSAVAKSLRPSEKAGVWLTPAEAIGGTFFPLVDGETTMLIPAERTAVPLVIRDGLPVAIGEPLTLGAGERETVRLSAPKAGHTDIAAWVRVDRSGGVDSTIDLPPPELEATAGATTVQLLVPLAGGLSSTQSLVFFRDVPIGPLQLVTGGKLWLHSEKPVEAQSGRVTAVRDPVLLVPAAALTLSWDLGTTNVQDEPCDVRSGPRPQPQLMATLERCLPSGCTPVVRERAAFTSRGVVAFEGIPAGDYQLQVVAPFAKSVSLEASLPAGRESMLSVPLKSFQFFGQVKLNGEPLRARLVFESGEALSDRTGRYTAVVAADPLTNSIRILPCDGTRAITWIPRERIAENSAFDIDLRTRTVRAKVIDSRGIPVSGAAVHFGTLQSETSDGIGYWSENTESDGDGHAVFESAPADKTLILCAEHAMHARVCSRFSSRDGQPAKEVVLQFEPVLARGKVVGHQGRATLAWVDRSGRITEEVSLAQEGDGGFILRQPHGRDEYLVYVSSARPLTVFSQPEPAPPGAELVVTLPTAPVRAFTVVIPPSTGDAFVGLWIGGRYVPLDLLVQHHDQRGSNVVPEGGKPLRFLDIAATGPIAVAYIPYLTMPGPFVDPFTRPEYANAERHVVAGAEVVIPPTASR